MKLARPDKHDYYIGIAEAVSRRSTCLRRHYGCVIVNNDEIISTGYNGNPRGETNCMDIGVCCRSGLCRRIGTKWRTLLSAVLYIKSLPSPS